jgi:hypothetical protein
MDFFRSRMDNLRAHPFQNIMGAVAGGFVPGGGLAAHALFNRYNDNNFNNAANQVYTRGQDQGNLDASSAMNAPLGDSRLSGDNAFDYTGPTGPNPGRGEAGPSSGVSNQDRQMMDALTGGGGGQNAGGMMGGAGYQPPGGWSQQTMSGFNPNQASGSKGFGLLDFLGSNPNQPFDIPTTMSDQGEGGGHMSPEARRSGMTGNHPGNYGVSNFMVGGSPVIFGQDPNGLAMANGRRTMY